MQRLEVTQQDMGKSLRAEAEAAKKFEIHLLTGYYYNILFLLSYQYHSVIYLVVLLNILKLLE